MAAKFIIKEKRENEYQFHLENEAGEHIIDGMGVYMTAEECKADVELIVANLNMHLEDRTIGMTDLELPRYEMFLDKAGHFRFRIRTDEAKVMALAPGKPNKPAAQESLAQYKELAAAATVEVVEK